MSNQFYGFYFTGNADRSAHDYGMHVDLNKEGNVVVGARYHSSARNTLFEMEMDAEDLLTFGQMCVDLARQMRAGQRRTRQGRVDK